MSTTSGELVKEDHDGEELWQRSFLEIIRRFWFRGKIGTTFVNSIVLIPCVLVLGIDPSRVIGAAEKSELPVISRIFVLESIEFNHAARLPARFRRNAGI
jgi:hypothetical protein